MHIPALILTLARNMEPHLELEHLGILRQTKLPAQFSWMSDVEKYFLLQVYLAGDGGLSKSRLKPYQRKHLEVLLNLEVRGLVTWHSDKAGHPVVLVLTWQGDEIAQLLLQIAKHENQRGGTPSSFASPTSHD